MFCLNLWSSWNWFSCGGSWKSLLPIFLMFQRTKQFWRIFSMLLNSHSTIKWRWKKFCCNYFDAKTQFDWTKYDHISAGLRSLWWLNIKQRLMVNDAVMLHRYLKVPSPSCLSDKFSTRAIVGMIDRQDIEIASIFHLVESMLANALFITLVWKSGII